MIPAQRADAGQYFFGNPSPRDNRVAAWDWTGLGNLNSSGSRSCSGVTQVSQAQGQLWSALPTEVKPAVRLQLRDPQRGGVLGG